MPLATILKPLFLPPAVFVLLVLVGILLAWRWRRIGLTVAWGSAVTLYLLATPLVGSRLLATQQTEPPLDAVAARSAQAGAIVVLSGDQHRLQIDYGSETVGPITLERLRRAARLQRDTDLPLMVSGGLLPQHAMSNAATMTEALQEDLKVPVRWQEARSRTTHENAAFSAEILRAQGISKVILVTSAWHMPRAVQAFRAQGIEPIAAPTGFAVPGDFEWAHLLPSPSGLQASQWALHEMLGRLWYRLAYG
jgi:uncharacterized SAM-binding protein YcdF (DUF218 family)